MKSGVITNANTSGRKCTSNPVERICRVCNVLVGACNVSQRTSGSSGAENGCRCFELRYYETGPSRPSPPAKASTGGYGVPTTMPT